MTHGVSITYARFDHISPIAMVLALALHVAIGAALWWISPLRPVDETREEPVIITMDQEPSPVQPPPTPQPLPEPEPVQPPRAASPPPPAPSMRLGLAPAGPTEQPNATPGDNKPAPLLPETPAEEAKQPEPPREPAKEPPPETMESPPPDSPKAEPQPEQQQALARRPTTPPPSLERAQPPSDPPPPQPAPPRPTLEQALPPIDAPPPPVTALEIPRPPPPPPAPPAPRPPPQRTQPVPRPPAPQQSLQPSPLTNPSRNRPSAEQQQAARQAPTLQNPADVYGRRRAEDEYIWYVARKISQHQQFIQNVTKEAGSVTLRLVIARDGRLLEVGVIRSSGLPSLDNASVNMIRQAAPYPALPPEIGGSQHSFTLPLYFRRSE